MPARPPQVRFQGGLLTIIANNSTLADILSAVHARTGAVMDAPPGLAAERVAVRLGPGPPREVLAALLNGSRFDYIILGSETDPNAVRRIMLTLKQGAAPYTTAAVSAPAPQPPAVTPLPPFRQPIRTPEEVDEQESVGVPEEAPEVPEQIAPPPAPRQAPAQPVVKTPEQLLQELQRMQKQQQEEQQRPQNPPQPPNQ